MPQARNAYQLPSRPESVSCARAWVREMLAADGCQDAIDPVLLILSELASNAVQHAAESGVIKIVCEVDSDLLTVGVIDYGKQQPVLLDATEDDESGRGLTLVDAISDEWGWQPQDGGKLVYARLKLAQASTAMEIK